jgi:glucan phosphoethanolaminetransferase (alkaline phosphatase superfamily)
MPIALNLQRRAWAAVSALILVIMLPNLIWLHIGHGLMTWISGLVIPSLLLAFLFAVFGKRIWMACMLLIPAAILAPIEAIYIATYLHPTDAEILATLVATNPREIDEYLGSALIPISVSITAGLLLSLLAARWSWQSRICWRHRSQAWVIATIITLPLAACVVSFSITKGNASARWQASGYTISGLIDSVEPGYPFGLYQRVAEYRQEWQQMRIDASRLDAFRFYAHHASATVQRQVYVLVIGESSRRDHWQLFGYSRATNPKLINVQNLIPIPDMMTSWPASLTAIPQLLTRKPITDGNIVWK